MSEFEFVWRHSDWRERAKVHKQRLDRYRWDKCRRGQDAIPESDSVGLTSPEYTRLLEELGGPFFLTPNGRFGSFPFRTTVDHGVTGWQFCAAIPLEKVRTLDFGVLMDEDEVLMIWPWIAQFACTYGGIQERFDRGLDLSPSALDEELDKVQSSALRLLASLEKIRAAGYIERPWTLEEVRKRVALGQISHRLEAAIADQTWQPQNFARKLAALQDAAKESRGALAATSLNVGKVGNPGIQSLTTACAYVWSDFSERKPSAARRISVNRGEESDFVLFVQSVARLGSDTVPTIAQVRDALATPDWNTDPERYFALRWNSTDGGDKSSSTVSGN